MPAAGKTPEFKGGFEYISANARAKLLLNLRTLLGDFTFSYLAKSSTALGGNFVFNPKTSALEKYDFGFNWSPAAGAVLGLKHESTNAKAVELGKFFVYVNHAANANQTVGTQFAFNYNTKASEATLGLAHKFNNETSGKVKVNDNGYVDTLLKHKLNDSVTASLASGFSLRTIVADSKIKKIPLGLAFDLKL